MNLNEIDFQTEAQPPLAEFDSDEPDAHETVTSWRQMTCEQGLFYSDHRSTLLDRYAGDYVFLQDDEVVWNGPDPSNLGSRRDLSGGKKDRALWLKLVDPDDVEGEHFEVYEEVLGQLR